MSIMTYRIARYKYLTPSFKEVHRALSYFIRNFHRPEKKLVKLYIKEMRFFPDEATCEYVIWKKHEGLKDPNVPDV